MAAAGAYKQRDECGRPPSVSLGDIWAFPAAVSDEMNGNALN